MTATVFLPDGRVLFDFQRPKIAGNAAFDAGGTRFEVIEPDRAPADDLCRQTGVVARAA